VGKHEGWFVVNDEWRLPKADALCIKGIVHGQRRGRMWRWPGERLDGEDLPERVPRQSNDWEYGGFWQSPTDVQTALYVAEDRHFDGCACTMRERKNYLGVADLRTGRLRRLTWGDNDRIGHASWSPDGELILYVRESFSSIDTPVRWSALYAVRPDGTELRRLARNVAGLRWISSNRIVAEIGLGTDEAGARQLYVVDVHSGQVHCLTGGYFRHALADVRGDRYLVVEKPVGGNRCQGNLYLMHKPWPWQSPARVARGDAQATPDG
jgi:hypothetical protein